ncbi:DNA-binding domain-containing protein [Hydrogenophaga crocea]|uniref:DDE-type integrase/transposase/recombinase n=1 Tax=Hydrogenophaga crocea TaxID=2716225 RepID=A0A6G8IIF6_9BURK|nr:DNA-binding domain-containing protein [Hydrogenophaga crocea]QIM52740.1 DDE-type integrase/transposase/recombinase [Hydrogenophaga crocea]
MQITLIAGLMLKHGTRVLEVVRELEDGEFILEDVLTRRPHSLTRTELLKRIYANQLVVVSGDRQLPGERPILTNAVVDLTTLSEGERNRLEKRLAYVKAAHRMRVTRGQRKRISKLIESVAMRLGDQEPPSASALMLWLKNYEKSSRNPLALVDRHRFRKAVKRLSSVVEALVWRTLKRHYFTKDRHTLKHAYNQLTLGLKEAVSEGAIPAEEAQVSIATLHRRVKDVDLYQRVASREGAARARMVCRTAFPDGVAEYPLQRVEIDHTPLNWVVICDRTGLPLGRPTLTVMIDAYSGYILGFYISFYGPGLTSVAGVVRNAVMPKDELTTGLGLTSRWIAHGLGDEWVIDNGLEFHSFGFKAMAMALGVDVMYCRVRTPWLKPHVERFFSGLNTLTLVKGRVSRVTPNIVRIDPYKDAAITFSDLVRGLLQYVTDVYPHQPNWRKMATPYELYADGVERCPPARYPGSFSQFMLASGMSQMLTFSQGGLQMLGLPYGSYDFQPMADKYGTGYKVLCKWDPDDISMLHVQTPDKRWIEAQCRWSTYAQGLSFNQHRLIRNFNKKQLQAPDREEQLLLAQQRLHEHWLDSTVLRKRQDALLAARSQDFTSAKVLSWSERSNTWRPDPLPANRLIAAEEITYAEHEVPSFDSFRF